MARGFKGTGAKVRRAGGSWVVTHGTTGEVLSRHGTEKAARKAATETRERNVTSTMRSAKNRRQHGSGSLKNRMAGFEN